MRERVPKTMGWHAPGGPRRRTRPRRRRRRTRGSAVTPRAGAPDSGGAVPPSRAIRPVKARARRELARGPQRIFAQRQTPSRPSLARFKNVGAHVGATSPVFLAPSSSLHDDPLGSRSACREDARLERSSEHAAATMKAEIRTGRTRSAVSAPFPETEPSSSHQALAPLTLSRVLAFSLPATAFPPAAGTSRAAAALSFVPRGAANNGVSNRKQARCLNSLVLPLRGGAEGEDEIALSHDGDDAPSAVDDEVESVDESPTSAKSADIIVEETGGGKSPSVALAAALAPGRRCPGQSAPLLKRAQRNARSADDGSAPRATTQHASASRAARSADMPLTTTPNLLAARPTAPPALPHGAPAGPRVQSGSEARPQTKTP